MDLIQKRSVETSHAIFHAVLEAKINSLHAIIQENRKVLEEKTDSEEWTPLHVAVILSSKVCVEVFLQQGADPYLKDRDGRIPLHWAGHRNVQFSVFKSLLANTKEAVEMQDVYGRTPMHYICMNERTTEVGDANGFKEIEMCDVHDSILKLYLLLNYVGDINLVDFEGNTPLHVLCTRIHNTVRSEEINRTLIPDGLQHLQSKSVCGFMLEMFLQQNADVSLQNECGLTVFHLACHSLCVEMIRLFLTQESCLPSVVNGFDTPPMTMIFSHSPIRCESLSYKDEKSDIFFQHMCRFEDCLRPVLKSMRAYLNHPNRLTGSTVLHQAVIDFRLPSDFVKDFIEYGHANVNVQNLLGKTPLHYARQGKTKRFLCSLKKYVYQNWKKKFDILLKHGADVNAKDIVGFTPLHDAALYDELDLARCLIENNANVHTRNRHGATPLHLLSISKQSNLYYFRDMFEPLLNLLLKSGVDINGQDVFDSSALHYAVYAGNKVMIQKLLANGIKKDLKDTNGLNAFEFSYIIHKMNVESLLNEREEAGLEKKEGHTGVIHMKNAEEWLTSHIADITLSEEKIRDLLQSPQTINFSNNNPVLKQILNLMKSVFDEIECRDKRFKVTMELSGSTREGTKVDAPDEFDILCFLDNFESLCQIEEQSNKEFIKCRRRRSNDSEMFNDFFDDNEHLVGSRITRLFYLYIKETLGNPDVWESAPGLIADEINSEIPSAADLPDILCLKFRYCDAAYKYLPVSCDIVPVIRQRSWWPSFAKQIGGLSSPEIINNGCMIMTVRRKHETLSGERLCLLTDFKVSVYLSECIVMQSLPRPIIESYKLAKMLVRHKNLYPALRNISEADMEVYEEEGVDLFMSAVHPAMQDPRVNITSYELKNALFYALEEEQPLPKRDVPDLQMTREWTARIFKRLQRFISHCHFPAYFLPTQQIRKNMQHNENTDMECMFCKIIAAISEGTL